MHYVYVVHKMHKLRWWYFIIITFLTQKKSVIASYYIKKNESAIDDTWRSKGWKGDVFNLTYEKFDAKNQEKYCSHSYMIEKEIDYTCFQKKSTISSLEYK